MLFNRHSLRRPFWVEAVHIFALCGAAVAQPIYGLLGGSPEFLVAHRAGPREIAGLVAVLSLGPPLVLIAIEAAVGLMSQTARRYLHLLFVWALVVVVVLQGINRFFPGTPSVPAAIAAIFALVAALLYARSHLLGRLTTMMAIGAIYFPVNFLLFTPVSSFILQSDAANPTLAAPIKGKIPVVLVIFDEFNPMALLNEKREIDAVRFPNLAALAQNSWWFPRATSIHPQTERAVPAILSGKFPKGDTSLPSHQSHPDNLFTLLGGAYSFNVAETQTALCPDTLCGTGQNPFEAKAFVSDLSVVYLHAILPRALASNLLPSLDAGWKRFDAPRPATPETKKAYSSLDRTRLSEFRNFVANAGESGRHLDFIHILLPHEPYQFLPDGSLYNGGMLPGGKWTYDQHLIDVAYQRFLLQAGLADTLVGELMQRLKDTGTYDEALVIVTADHGKVFRAGTETRELKENNPDVLHIPLFVKLPNQREGQVSERFVSNLDVLPTIADVLDIEAPWTLDGTSVLAKNSPETTLLEVSFRGRALHFDRKEIVALPQFDWHVRTFGSDTPLDTVAIVGPHSDLVGRSVSDLKLRQLDAGGPALLSPDLQQFANVDIAGGYLPVLVRGTLQGSGSSDQQWVALALNGTIAVVTPTYVDAAQEVRVMTLIPQSAFVEGNNALTAYFVSQSEGERRLLPIETPATETFTLETYNDGSEGLLSSAGESIPIAYRRGFGHVDRLVTDATAAEIVGWSADMRKKTPVRLVVAFVDGKFAYATVPATKRPDVAKAYGSEQLANCGYSMIVPMRGKDASAASFRLFGISPAGIAGELILPKSVQQE